MCPLNKTEIIIFFLKEKFFNDNLPTLDGNISGLLPSSFHDVNVDQMASGSPVDMVNTIFTIFVMLKLISVGHPSSKPYYQEICNSMYPSKPIVDCEQTLFNSFQKYDHFRQIESFANHSNVFEDSYELLMFAFQHMVKNTMLGEGFKKGDL